MQPSSQTLTAIQSWASRNNLTTNQVSSNGNLISFTTTYVHANTLFDANYSTYSHPDASQPIVRTLCYSLPAELVDHVRGIHPATSFMAPNTRHIPVPANMPRQQTPVNATSCEEVLTPACLSQLYGIPTTPATQQNNTMIVTGYQGQFAIHSDLQVRLYMSREWLELIKITAVLPKDPT